MAISYVMALELILSYVIGPDDADDANGMTFLLMPGTAIDVFLTSD